MVRLADGDRSAFDPMFDALWPLVRRFAERAVGPADADDAAQVALLKLFERAGEYDVTRPALPWIFGVVAYACRTVRQRRVRRREAPDTGLEVLHADDDVELAVLRRDLEVALHEVIGTLRDDDRATLAALMEGRRPDASGATFRKRVERALKRLRIAWSTRHGSD